MTKTPLALDLFRGAGGWSLGARALGIHDHGVEIMKEANATAEAAGFTTVGTDVWNPPFTIFSGMYTGLIASPPCQTFSAAGKGKGREALDTVSQAIDDQAWLTLEGLRELGREVGDERTALVLTPLFYWHTMRPEWVALEQVPSVLPVWEKMAEVAREWGYSVWTGVLQAEQYGVAQTRKRAVLIASRVREVSQPQPTHSKYYARDPKRHDEGLQPWVSMSDALNGFGLTERPSPTITGGGTETGGAEPIAKLARYTNRTDWQPRAVVAAGVTGAGTPRDVEHPAPTMTAKGTAYWLETEEAYRRPDLPQWAHNRPSTTIVGSFKPEVVASPGYRVDVSRQNAPDSVRVSVAEAGVLQSFPADYPWQGSKTKTYLQAGNAVPPLLAQAVLAEAAGIVRAGVSQVDMLAEGVAS